MEHVFYTGWRQISSKLQFPYGMDERLEFSTFHLKQYHVVFRTNDKLLFLVNRRLLFLLLGIVVVTCQVTVS